MDKTSLESSIQRECDEAVAAIGESETEEIRRLDVQCHAAVDSFRRQTTDETDAQIRLEIVRLENKALLERRKNRLRSLEDFIHRLVDEVMAGLREHPRYPQFILDAVTNAVKDIPGRADVRLAAGDLALEDDIRLTLKTDRLVLKEDPSIRWGGCLILDEEGGRIFNGTLERIYFRRSAAIRRKVARILADNSEDADKERTT